MTWDFYSAFEFGAGLMSGMVCAASIIILFFISVKIVYGYKDAKRKDGNG